MWEVNKKDLEILKELRLDENPFRAVKEYSPLMSEIRWELPEQQELYKICDVCGKYITGRMDKHVKKQHNKIKK